MEIDKKKISNKGIMKFALTCPCCGSSNFNLIEMTASVIEGYSYISNEDIMKDNITCSICNLELYVGNLEVKVYRSI